MSVVGVGVDAVEVGRVRLAVQRTPSLLERVWTERERAACTARGGDWRWGGLAGRFAAKEAVAKAFGTGVQGFAFRDIEVLNDDAGRPTVELHGTAAATARRAGIDRVHLSLSATADLAVASAVAEHG